MAVSPGDLEMRAELANIEGAVYTENMHWGYIWDAPPSVQTTSIPTLGLVHLTGSEHANATQAMFYDNVSYFQKHNMLHALTSPLGTMQWTLATSPYWTVAVQTDGATLWALAPEGDATVLVLDGIQEEDCDGAMFDLTRGGITSSETRSCLVRTALSYQREPLGNSRSMHLKTPLACAWCTRLSAKQVDCIFNPQRASNARTTAYVPMQDITKLALMSRTPARLRNSDLNGTTLNPSVGSTLWVCRGEIPCFWMRRASNSSG